jgi:hypothetical protein
MNESMWYLFSVLGLFYTTSWSPSKPHAAWAEREERDGNRGCGGREKGIVVLRCPKGKLWDMETLAWEFSMNPKLWGGVWIVWMDTTGSHRPPAMQHNPWRGPPCWADTTGSWAPPSTPLYLPSAFPKGRVCPSPSVWRKRRKQKEDKKRE